VDEKVAARSDDERSLGLRRRGVDDRLGRSGPGEEDRGGEESSDASQ
jgi:hypothetical protein